MPETRGLGECMILVNICTRKQNYTLDAGVRRLTLWDEDGSYLCQSEEKRREEEVGFWAGGW